MMLQDITKGAEIFGVVTVDDIPCGHKMALRDIARGENVVKMGILLAAPQKIYSPAAM